MNKYMFSIFDLKARYWSNPFVAVNGAMAQREFGRVVNEVGNPIHDNPEDFELHEVAQFDDETGKITPHLEPHFIIPASHLRKFDAI